MEKTMDLLKELKQLYQPSPKEPVIVDVPAFNFLMLDGQGDPNTSQLYQEVVSALYSLSYTIKFAIKKAQAVDFKVMPLEGLWWVEGKQNDQADFLKLEKDAWFWTMMILQPPLVTRDWVETARETAMKKAASSQIGQIRFEPYHEGLSVQVMHLGPYSTEAPNIARMHEFALTQGYQLRGKHHEIYLGDPRRTAPEKLRTVLRQPVEFLIVPGQSQS
jgi:hypothetical protein